MHHPTPLQFYGGLQLLLDLQGAFDCVDRSSLFSHLYEMQVPSDLCALLAHWHCNTSYHLGAGEQSTKVSIGRGVRQGCKIAPTLWLTFLDQLFSQLIPMTGLEWLRRNVTIFADEFHIASHFTDEQEFQLSLKNIGHLLDVVEHLKLKIQYAKSHMLLTAHGSKAKKQLAPYLRDQGRDFTFLRPSGKQVTFSLCGSAKYLGILVSYGQFEMLTLRHRIRAAQTAFTRLQKWLCSQQLTIKHRLHLLLTCILPVLTYGLHVVTCSIKGLQEFQTTVFRMIRRTVGDHAYQTHHTHNDVLTAYNIQHPLLLLHGIGARLERRLTERMVHLAPDNILREIDWSCIPDFQLLLTTLYSSTTQAPLMATADVPIEVPNDQRAASSSARDPPGALPLDQFHVMTSQPFGSEVADLIHFQNWDALRDHEDASAFLVHNCPACGLWNGRTQAVHSHLKQHHPFNLKGVFEKAAQLNFLHCCTSPCVFCKKEFKRSHSCTVMTHAAMIWMAGLADTDKHRELLTCSICHQVFDNLQGINRHLKDQHTIQLCSYNSARDCLPGSTACAHCGAVFQTSEGIRQHINDGRCAHFDASASHISRDVGRNWDFLLASGDFDLLYKDPRRRMTSTLHCQFCGARYTRQMDLSAHLAQIHPELWMSSHSTLRLLLETIYRSRGCACNPSTSDRSLTHICPALRQIAMAFCNSTIPMLIPTKFTEEHVIQKLSHAPTAPALPLIQQALMHRDFPALWTTAAITDLLRHTCLLCGGTFHPAELALHIQRAHMQETQHFEIYMNQLVDSIRADCQYDWTCVACGLTYNHAPTATDPPEDRLLQQDIHLRSSCFVTLQCCYLFLPTYGLRSSGRTGCRDAGGLSSTGTAVSAHAARETHKRRRVALEEFQNQARANPARRLQECHAADPATHGDAAVAARSRSMPATQARLLHLLHANQGPRHPSGNDSGGGGVEEISDDGTSPAPVESSSDQLPGHLPSHEGESGLRESAGPEALGHSNPTTDSHGLRELAIHDVVSSGEQAHSFQTEASADGQDAEGARAFDRAGQGDGVDHTLQQSAASGTHSGMEPAAELQGRHSLVSPTGAHPEQLLEPDRSIHEIELPSSDTQCSSSRTTPGQGEGQAVQHGQRQRQAPDQMTEAERHELRAKLSRLVLTNLGQNVCYANSAFHATLWAFASRRNFTYGDWGEHAALFRAMLDMHQQQPLSLSQQQWFLDLLNAWPEEEGQGPADSAEFVHLLLTWISSDCLAFGWEKRLQQGTRILTHDRGARFMPLQVQIEPALCEDGAIPVSALLRHWFEELGMCQALLQDTDLICIHIDRLTRNGRDEIIKDCTPLGLHCGQKVPFFTGPGISCDWHDFHVIAATAHFGDTVQGHYQSLLSIANPRNTAMEPFLWLHTDDNRAPRPIWQEPPEFLAAVTLIWLCRETCIEVHEYDDHMSYPFPTSTMHAPDMLEVLAEHFQTR
eukprot:s2221_g1.t1